jgi:hypothetical protein
MVITPTHPQAAPQPRTQVSSPPRSFYPDDVHNAPPNHGPPGWQLGLERRADDGRTLARAMALFSFSLGLVEVLAPRKVTRFLGVDDRHANLVRLYGLREIASGVGIYSRRTPTTAVWSRVAGDALDLATLGMAFRRDTPRTGRVLIALGAVAGAAALDVLSAVQLQRLPADDGSAEGRAA